MYTPYSKKGILYFGARCIEGCSNPIRSLNKSTLEAQIDDLFQRLVFVECELQELDGHNSRELVQLERHQKDEETALDRQRRKLTEDLSYLEANKLLLLRSGVYTPESLQKQEEKLCQGIEQITFKEAALGITASETTNSLKKLSELLKSLYFYFKNTDSDEKEECTRKLFSELAIAGNTLRIKYRNGLQVLERRLYAYGAPTAWISEAGQNYHLLEESTRVIEEILSARTPPDS